VLSVGALIGETQNEQVQEGENEAMSEQAVTTEQEWHEKSAKALFNLTWDLLEKADRTPDEDDKMVHAAHASRFHWGEIGTPLEFERGEWQISRVYSVLNRPEPALYHAQRCLAICQENAIEDFDIAFAYEAMARAYAVAGDAVKSNKYITLGKQAAEQIEDAGDRDYFAGELEGVSELLE
jgi:hypothetical protein